MSVRSSIQDRAVGDDRLPTGLTFAAFVAAISLGVLTVFGGIGVAGGDGPERLVHTATLLCLAWATAAWLVARLGARWPTRLDLLAVLDIGALTTGLLAALVLIYIATIELLCRTVYFPYLLPVRVNVWATGPADLGGLAAALLLAYQRTRRGELVTASLWTLVLGALWASFASPAAQPIDPTRPFAGELPGDWGGYFLVCTGALISVFIAAEAWARRRRRARAWPDALPNLIAPPRGWPGFDYSAGLAALLVLFGGCVYVVLPWTALGSFVAAAGLLTIVAWRWNDTLADASLALITLGVVCVCLFGLHSRIWTADDFAMLLNRTVLALAIMTWFWHWLARFWRQQLADGRAWTTAGQLIRNCRRVGYLMGTLAVFIAMYMALWPRMPEVFLPGTSVSQWAWGLAGHALLMAALLLSLRGTDRSTLGWLVVLTGISSAAFIIFRVPVLSRWWGAAWPVGVAGGSVLLLLIAGTIRRESSWRAMREALLLIGILGGPMCALMGLAFLHQLRLPPWVAPLSLGWLTAAYVVAALRPGPASFASLAALCGVAGLWYVRDTFGPSALPLAYFYPALAAIGAALLGSGHWLGPTAVGGTLLKSLGGGLVLVAAAAGGLALLL